VTFVDQLREAGVVAILRAGDGGAFAHVGEALADAGVTCLEVTMTSAGALDSLRELAARLPDALLGVGSVLDAATAEAAIDAGAAFLVSPALVPAVVQAGAERGVPVLPGALTPTEILAAHAAGAAAVKVFPAGPAGGVEYVRAVRAPLPQVSLVPTGGIDLDDVEAYLRAGCVAVGIGGPLIGDACDGGDLDALRERARRALAGVARAGEARR
jgi:2-dehydro-3-deoxyphosphogluconate aldolase/(4S)-4-hydroxy-2-oxoglutarate aldolase